MKAAIRKLLPNSLVNKGKHLPVAVAANLRYGFPSRGMKVIGVTGTDGKTTTVNMIYRILRDAGKKVGMISTVKAEIDGKVYDTGFHVTTPSPVEIQKYLSLGKKAGVEYFVIEVSSHSLDQYRVWGIKFDIGVVTNITHDHLDYHKSWDNYFLAKSKILLNSRIAVINRDEDHFNRLRDLASGEVVSFGFSSKSDLNMNKFPIKVGIPGDFNKLNGLAAAGACLNLGVSSESIKKTLANFEPVPGRMNEIQNTRGIRVFIDFASTPNSLKSALEAMKGMHPKNLIAVFGSAGYRDIEKRAMMGEVAAKLADKVVVTSEDPRGLLEQINEQIISGVRKVKSFDEKNLFIEGDRGMAIRMAIRDLAKKGDLVGIFGKGHEGSNNMTGKEEMPWSDFDEAKKALK